MTQTYTENVVIDGAADETQLTIQGNGNAGSEQSAALQSWQTADSVEQARITGDGRLQVGSFNSGMMATDDALIEAHRSETDTGKPDRGFHLLGAFTGTLSSIISWIVQELVLKGTGGISALHTAWRVRLTNENTGDMTGAELLGGDIEVQNDGGHGGANGKVPSAVGLRVGVLNQANGHLDIGKGLEIEMVDSGAADNLIGLDIADVDGGSVDNYAIRTGAGKVKLGVVTTGLIKSVNGVVQNIDDEDDSDAVMTGATDTVDGKNGLVPQPLAGDEGKFLRGDKTWAVPAGYGGIVGADGISFVDPNLQTWNELNQSSGDYEENTSNKRLTATALGNGTYQLRGWYTSAPTPPYSITMRVKSNFRYGVAGIAVGFRQDLTGELACLSYYPNPALSTLPVILNLKFNNPSSYNTFYGTPLYYPQDIEWFKIEDDNTNRIVYISADGVIWDQIHSVARTDFLTPDGIFFGLFLSANNVRSSAALLSYEEA